MNINAIVYVSPIIDNSTGKYIVDYVEMVNDNLVVKEAIFDTLLKADDAIKALKKQLKNI